MRKRKVLVGLCLGLGLGSGLSKADLPLVLPGPAVKPVVADARIEELNRKNLKVPTYKAYRELAQLYLGLGRYDDAGHAYRNEAALFRRNGLQDAALLEDKKAARYESEVRIFMDRQVTSDEEAGLYTGAMLEPRVGTYLGAYIDLDDEMKSWQDAEGRDHRRPEDFEKLVGKRHGTYFMYIAYGKPAPVEWLEQCKRAGAIAHLAFEPNDLGAVKDDEYLRDFARDCNNSKVPVFLRYGSEMNGDWTKWHGDPALYREKFRLVYRVFKRYAPNVAVAWCVNSVPLNTIDQYYPGDDACDWVGVNVYSVPFYGNDLKRPGLQDSALPFIDPIYKRFSARKPIAICEFGSSYMAEVDKVQRTDFAVSRMAYLYNALPRFYPRIKMINWFSVNTIRHGSPGAPNNYSLTENAAVMKAYQDVTKSAYFLSAPRGRGAGVADAANPSMPRLLFLGEQVKGAASISLWIKTCVDNPRVYLTINNAVVYAREGNGVHSVTIDTDALPPGRKRLRVYVYDDQNRFISTAATTITVGNARVRGNQPLQVTGTVQRYYINRAGLVSALDVKTLGTLERVHFDSSQAAKMTAAYPVYSEITAWVLPRDEAQPVPGVDKSWNLLGTTDEEPEYDPRKAAVETDTEYLEAEQPAGTPGITELKGILTDVVRNEKGEVIALIIDNAALVQVPPALRAPKDAPKDAADATSLTLGAPVTVSGAARTTIDGQISIYGQRLSAASVTVNGQKAARLKFSGALGRGIRATAREATDDDNDTAEVIAAQTEGLDVYVPPLPAAARFAVRGLNPDDVLRQLDLDPVVEANQRPW